MKKIAMFFSFDNGYVPQAGVTFESLLSNAKEEVFYELYIVYSDINKENKNKLKSLIEWRKNADLSFINISDSIINFDVNENSFTSSHAGTNFTKDTFYRCIPDLIPEFNKYDKIIYSDVDIIVIHDISELWDINLDEKYLAGVKAPQFLWEERTHLPEKFEDKYFAGGLWIMNLKQMRKDRIGNKALNIIKNPPVKLRWNDQDVMNLACDTRVHYISYRYISVPDWFSLLKRKNFKDKYYPNGEMKECMFEAKIIHYAGRKPWKDLATPKSDLWFYWLEKSGFEDTYSSQLISMVKRGNRVKAVLSCLRLIISQVPLIGRTIFKIKKVNKIYHKLGIYLNT